MILEWQNTRRSIRVSLAIHPITRGCTVEIDFSNVKPGVLSALTILLIVMITVPLAKYVLNRWRVPGLTDLVNAV